MQTEPELTDWLRATPNSNRVSILFEELGLTYDFATLVGTIIALPNTASVAELPVNSALEEMV